MGSITIIGTVSPAGGNFQEPVTQATLATVGAFWGLSRARAEARKFPSVEPTESWSKYRGSNDSIRGRIVELLEKGKEVKEMITVVGKEGVSNEDFLYYLKAETIDKCLLQQNAFDDVDAFCGPDRLKEIERIVGKFIEFKPEYGRKKEIEEIIDKFAGQWINWNYTDESNSRKYRTDISELEKIISGGV
jgi:V/A-type H+-transporting ATPase subunit A